MTVRSRLASDLEGNYELVRQALEDAMSAERKAWGFCPDCRKKVQVDQPDHSARIRAVELWLTEGFGKPGTTSPAPVVPDLSRPVSEMTDEELEAIMAMSDAAIIAAGGDVSDPNDVSGVDWAERAREPRQPDPLLARRVG